MSRTILKVPIHAPPRYSVEEYNVYTDGACSHNGTTRAIAGIGVWIQEDLTASVSEPLAMHLEQTNNSAELRAILKGLEIASRARTINVYTDSDYSYNALTLWSEKWKANNWRTAKGDVPKNLDVIKDIKAEITRLHTAGHKVNLFKVKAHSTNIGNNAANDLAQKAVKDAQRSDTARVIDILKSVNDIYEHTYTEPVNDDSRQTVASSVEHIDPMSPSPLRTRTSSCSHESQSATYPKETSCDNCAIVLPTIDRISRTLADLFHTIVDISQSIDNISSRLDNIEQKLCHIEIVENE